MPFLLYDFVNDSGKNEFKIWTKGLEKIQQAKLEERLDKLAAHGDELFPKLLSSTSERGILKLRVHGKVQLRPLLCRGPLKEELSSAYTLLLGAKEVGDRWQPRRALETAKNNKEQIINCPLGRRTEHEWID